MWVITVGFFLVIGALLFGVAGRLNILPFWEYVAVLVANSLIGLFVLDPALLQERMRPGGNAVPLKYWLGALPGLAHWCVAALDVGRYHWSDAVPWPLQTGALLLLGLSLALITWAMHANPFASTLVRIQAERSHKVITSGPYGWVRHPIYTAFLMYCLVSGVALSSLLSTLPMLALVAFVFVRTVREDRFLCENLPGYGQYAKSVRYRLVPRVW